MDEEFEVGGLNEGLEAKGLGERLASEGEGAWTTAPGDESDDELLAGPLGRLPLADPVACSPIPLTILQVVEHVHYCCNYLWPRNQCSIQRL